MGGYERRPGGSDLGQAGPGGGAGAGAVGARTLTGAVTPAARPADPIREVTDLLNGPGGAAAAFEKMKTLEEAQQTTVATRLGAAPRTRLSTNLQRGDVTGEAGYALLRRCFDATPATEVATLCRWTGLRFDLTVSRTTDGTGAPWDKRGLRRCWDVLQALPAAHVENNADLSSLTRYRSTSIEGWASDDGEAAIGYGNSNRIDTAVETGDFTDARDPLRGKNIFDATVRHEIGHRVDASVGGPAYCATDAGGGWQTWDSIDGMAERLVNASGGKISTWPDAAEKTAIIGVLQAVIAARKPNQINTKLAALPFLSRHATDAAQRAKLDDIKNDEAVAALQTRQKKIGTKA